VDNDDRGLKGMLVEDVGHANDVEALLGIIHQLRRWDIPTADAESKAQLIEKMSAEVLRQPGLPVRWAQCIAEWWPLLLIRTQMRIVQGEIWLASALVITLGLVVTFLTYDQAMTLDALPIVLMAPVITAVGIALLYNGEVEQTLELERGTPASMQLILLARMVLVYGFDFVLGLTASIVLWLVHSELALWPLVLDWLAPMTFLSALAFLVSVFSLESLTGITASLGLWVCLVIMKMVVRLIEPASFYIPDLTTAAMYPWVLGISLMLGAAALALVGRHERYAGGWR